jgi:D-mannonate dehydratase
MEKEFKVSGEILFYAFRYALGRMTYAPTSVMDNIKANIKDISTADIEKYIKEIKECKEYGMEIDRQNWLSFLDYLKSELDTREKKI